jgi:hypothetical protein
LKKILHVEGIQRRLSRYRVRRKHVPLAKPTTNNNGENRNEDQNEHQGRLTEHQPQPDHCADLEGQEQRQGWRHANQPQSKNGAELEGQEQRQVKAGGTQYNHNQTSPQNPATARLEVNTPAGATDTKPRPVEGRQLSPSAAPTDGVREQSAAETETLIMEE